MTGGSIESISLSGRLFAVAADADGERNLGGFQNEVQMNGDGNARLIKTRIPARLSGISISIDDTRGDQEYVQNLANGKTFFPVSITFASGEVYQGTLQLTDESNTSTQSTTMAISLMGPGELTKQ